MVYCAAIEALCILATSASVSPLIGDLIMRQVLRYALLSLVLSTTLLALSPAQAADHSGSRQSFGDWHGHSQGFSYRPYYYKPNPEFVGFNHHYVIHYQAQPQYNY